MNREQSVAVMTSALNDLRDVAGVHGSFVLSQSGELVSKDLPAVFDEHVFAEVGPRVARLWETFSSVGEDVDGCLLRFAEHKLFIRAMNEGTVGVLLTLEAHMPALRMAVSLVVRRIAPQLAAYHRDAGEVPALLLPASAPAALPISPPASLARQHQGRMVFRGHEVK